MRSDALVGHHQPEKEVRHDLSDDEVRDVAAKEMKKRAESIEAFEGAGRRELAEGSERTGGDRGLRA